MSRDINLKAAICNTKSLRLAQPTILSTYHSNWQHCRRDDNTECQKFCPIHPEPGGERSSSLRATQSRRIGVQRTSATAQKHGPFGQDFWQLL
jgi:hypothetical protein